MEYAGPSNELGHMGSRYGFPAEIGPLSCLEYKVADGFAGNFSGRTFRG